MFKKCKELREVKGIATRVNGDDLDITVECWTDMFVNEYLIPKYNKKQGQKVFDHIAAGVSAGTYKALGGTSAQ